MATSALAQSGRGPRSDRLVGKEHASVRGYRHEFLYAPASSGMRRGSEVAKRMQSEARRIRRLSVRVR